MIRVRIPKGTDFLFIYKTSTTIHKALTDWIIDVYMPEEDLSHIEKGEESYFWVYYKSRNKLVQYRNTEDDWFRPTRAREISW